MRVHELARELGVASKHILAALDDMGLEGRIALSSVPEAAEPRLRRSVWITVWPAEAHDDVSGSGRPMIRFRRTAAEVVEMLRVQLQQRPRVSPGPPSPGPLARWRARRMGRLEAGRAGPPRPSPLARVWARRSGLLESMPPRPGLGQRLALRRAGPAALVLRIGGPPFRGRQELVMAGAAVLLIALALPIAFALGG